MRIVIVTGFVAMVKHSLDKEFQKSIEERSVIWNAQNKGAEIDVRQFKSDFLDQVSQGATDFLICVGVNRRDVHGVVSLEGIVQTAKNRQPDLKVKTVEFKSVFETTGLATVIEAFQPTREKQFSGVLADVESWLNTQHPQRLILHPRAIRGLKKSLFQDVPLLYGALDLLAIEYRDNKLAPPDQATSKQQKLDDRLTNLGLELSLSISRTGAGEHGDDYFIEFPQGETKNFLSHHLKRGVAHDERICLRIYFFWSDTHHCAVVGWMTTHLGTKGG